MSDSEHDWLRPEEEHETETVIDAGTAQSNPEVADAVAKILTSPRETQETLRRTARDSVEHCFSMPRMAQETAEALQAVIGRNATAPDLWPNRSSAPTRCPTTDKADPGAGPLRTTI